MSLPFNDVAQNDVQSAEMGTLRDTFKITFNDVAFETTCTMNDPQLAHNASGPTGMG